MKIIKKPLELPFPFLFLLVVVIVIIIIIIIIIIVIIIKREIHDDDSFLGKKLLLLKHLPDVSSAAGFFSLPLLCLREGH